ncbi:Zinc finger protein ZAT5 [Apostasia shenzhenica]|uniref:Zinc finger protein ZAT5 n=1 Tax=Apostasia shenzhenica TaxID=1088818 RepID=A0A2I0BF47_9ASPA|nr:Zinc finger protein ZAT5 [Apostasia shenzhenica]
MVAIRQSKSRNPTFAFLLASISPSLSRIPLHILMALAQEELEPMASYSSTIKGKRSRRAARAAPSSSSSSSAEDYSVVTDEEEDMAHCLILLAQGRAFKASNGSFLYECKTCSKRFPTFQALGGHRASHKKALPPPPETRHSALPPPPETRHEVAVFTRTKVHECSICGAEFSSGQALGGHMRRHRPAVLAEEPEQKKMKTPVMPLDLNLPAPSDDADGNGDSFITSSVKPLIFSPATLAAALVDCRY